MNAVGPPDGYALAAVLFHSVSSRSAPPGTGTMKATIKVSPPMMKVLSLILSKHVREYEERIGRIPIPNQILHDLGLEEMIE